MNLVTFANFNFQAILRWCFCLMRRPSRPCFAMRAVTQPEWMPAVMRGTSSAQSYRRGFCSRESEINNFGLTLTMIYVIIFSFSPLNCSKGEQWSQLRYTVNKQLLQHSVMNLTDTLHSVSEDMVSRVKKSRQAPTMQLNELYKYLTMWAYEGR